jgi:inositol-phosphate transport system permease protein
MTTIEEQLMIERRGHAASVARRRTNFVIFLGPAIVLTVLFFGVPVIIDVAVSFTDLSRSLRITEFTTEQYEKVFRTDRRLSQVIGLTFIYVFGTLAIFNVTFGLILAITTTAIRNASGSFFRGVWLLPRMSPSVLYILLWLWAVSPTEAGLVNQVLMQAFGLDAPLDLLTSAPIALIIISNGFIGASMGMIIFTAAIRSIPEHLFHAAAVDGAGTFATIRFITLPALRWPISFVTIYQTLSLLVIHPAPHQGRAILRHDRICALRVPSRLRERTIRLRSRAGAFSHRHWRSCRTARLALLRYGASAAAPPYRGTLRWPRR